jgi:hypothetical protein
MTTNIAETRNPSVRDVAFFETLRLEASIPIDSTMQRVDPGS